MDYDDFVTKAKSGEAPPDQLDEVLKALWADKAGDWDLAHELSQRARSKEGDWVHAYLHRKEGDEGNAGYWYSRSGKPFFSGSLDAEWSAIVKALL